MSESLQWKIQENGDVTTFFFKGDITEQSRFDLLEKAFEPYQNRSVFINLRFIENMNSSGINKWMKLISFLIDNNIYVEFKECSVEIVLQLNMISNFNGGYAIQSFYAPFYCETCDVDSNVLVKLPDSPELAAVRFGISLSCGKCNGVKNFDDIAEVYLKFLDYLNIDKDRVTK